MQNFYLITSALLQEHKIEISMSRTGNPYDNTKAERSMRTLKYEEIYMNDYEILGEVRASIEHFIETIYNRKRLSHRLPAAARV